MFLPLCDNNEGAAATLRALSQGAPSERWGGWVDPEPRFEFIQSRASAVDEEIDA